ncbi:MAG: FAD-dependent oxidoreductase, partial [Bacteroidales bacterium]
MKTEPNYSVIIIGAGLSGLTTAFQLVKRGIKVAIVEKQNRIGGQINSLCKNGFIYETGPNTGVLNNYEVIDLFNNLLCDS